MTDGIPQQAVSEQELRCVTAVLSAMNALFCYAMVASACLNALFCYAMVAPACLLACLLGCHGHHRP